MQAIVLESRPHGVPVAENFGFREIDMPEISDDEVLIRAEWFSVDPYLRGRMNDVKSYVPPFGVGEPISSSGIGVVVASKSSKFVEGDRVLGPFRWQEFDVQAGKALTLLPVGGDMPLQHYLGALGMPGLTAYVGLFDIGSLREGQVVFVSGAAGAVGSLVGQIAKTKGSYVIGSAGTEAKVRRLKELGFDAAFCYSSVSPKQALRSLAPEGIDLYFDNVGGDHLDAALASLRPFSVAVLCGSISSYHETTPVKGPENFSGAVVTKRLRVQGFIVSDHSDRRESFVSEMTEWIRTGAVVVDETVAEGFAALPEAFIGLFRGDNLGKMLVHVGE
jgi:NADPH-dependent curcumin reductase CurA